MNCHSDAQRSGCGRTCFPLNRHFSVQRATLRLIRALAIFLCFIALVSEPLVARSKPSAPAVGPDYVFALSAANQFLYAWQTNDRETVILMLTDRMKQGTREEVLASFFSPSGAGSQSFEIGRGRKVGPGRYKFPVRLFQKVSTNKRISPQASTLIVVRAGKNDWAIDRLP
jgi:hypothetical protein